MNWSKKTILSITALVVAGSVGIALKNSDYIMQKLQIKSTIPVQQAPSAAQETWMTVFVHGSFASLMGFLSLPNVVQDKITGTAYRKVVRKMREDDFYFKDQPMLQRGLVRITPSFDLAISHNKPYAAYPLAAMYNQLDLQANPEPHTNLFYTFGWSGLMSQSSRRYESFRLYNSLSKELERLADQGIYPKIRLIAHSHGGNMCLNLAGINTLLNLTQLPEDDQSLVFSSNPDEQASLVKIYTIMLGLAQRDDTRKNMGQKIFDYAPANKKLSIDELIMFATPIQPETEYFATYPFFKKVFNIYSAEDIVQSSDWVTSREYLGKKQFASLSPDTPHIKQIKIMIDQSWQTSETLDDSTDDTTPKPQSDRHGLQEFLSGNNPFVRKSKDPTHKEFWFLSWKESDATPPHFLLPLPVFILTPFLIKAVEMVEQTNNLDANISTENSSITIQIAQHKTTNPLAHVSLQQDTINHFKKQIIPWRPKNLSSKEEFDMVYQRSREA